MTATINSIAIALAVYKPDRRYFFEQLKSIQDQTYPHFDCWITFDSPIEEIAEWDEFTSFKNDLRFHWIENKIRLGARKNFEMGAHLATLNKNVLYILFSDQDDVWFETKIETSLKLLKLKPPLSLVQVDMWEMTIDGTVLRDRTVWEKERRGLEFVKPIHLLYRNVIAGAGLIMDANLVRQYPTIPESFYLHDWWWAFCAAMHGGVYSLRTPLYLYRQHGANVAGISEYKGLVKGDELRQNPMILWNKTQKNYLKTVERWNNIKELKLPFPGVIQMLKLCYQSFFKDRALFRTVLSQIGPALIRFF